MTRSSCSRPTFAALTGVLLMMLTSLGGLRANAQIKRTGALPTAIVKPAVAATTAADDANHKATVKLQMQQISGLTKTGSPDPSQDGACKVKFGRQLSKTAVTTYSISLTGQSAITTFQSQKYLQHPLGIAGKYVFGAYFQPPRPPNSVYGDIFSISLTFTNPVTSFILVLDEQTNCLLSSSAKPMDEPESIRFGSSPK